MPPRGLADILDRGAVRKGQSVEALKARGRPGGRLVQRGVEDETYYPEARRQGLDLSESARLARAREQGYDTGQVWWHGAQTPRTDFEGDAFRIDRKTRRSRYPGRSYFAGTEGEAKPFGRVSVPVYLRRDRILDLSRAEHRKVLDEVVRDIGAPEPFFATSSDKWIGADDVPLKDQPPRRTRHALQQPSFEWFDGYAYGERDNLSHLSGEQQRRLQTELSRRGYDGMLLSGDGENAQAVVWNRKAIRHVDAVFNPKHLGSGDIYSDAGPALPSRSVVG